MRGLLIYNYKLNSDLLYLLVFLHNLKCTIFENNLKYIWVEINKEEENIQKGINK